jgi:hypothetical protein
MTDELTVLVRKPGTICEACVANSRHQSEEVGVVWCEHSRYGGVYYVPTGMWQISGPFAVEDDFKRAVYRAYARLITKN